MSRFFTSSIGSKFLVSVSGLFLILFLIVHLSVNSLLMIGDGTLFNQAAHFMATTPAIRVMEPVLALGFIIHILYAIYVTLKNQNKRPVNYSKNSAGENSNWASRNMFVLGALIFIFLVIHVINFFWKLRFGGGEVETVMINGEEMHNAFKLVNDLFAIWWYDVIYILGAIVLAFHLSHGFWSAFQTVGWSGTIWRRRFEVLGTIFAVIFGVGFAIIPIVLFIKAHLI